MGLLDWCAHKIKVIFIVTVVLLAAWWFITHPDTTGDFLGTILGGIVNLAKACFYSVVHVFTRL